MKKPPVAAAVLTLALSALCFTGCFSSANSGQARQGKEMMEAYPKLHLIASGGVSSIDDIKALDAAGIPAVVFGKAIYEGKINLNELWDWQNA